MTNDDALKENLTISRLYIGMSYLNVDLLNLLIHQLAQVGVQKIAHTEYLCLTLTHRFAHLSSGMRVEQLLNFLKI